MSDNDSTQIKIIRGVSSSQPCIRGIMTHIMAGRFIAGESIASIAQDYELTKAQVEQAIRYELAKAERLKLADDMVKVELLAGGKENG